ncbi:MAG TPA: antibiotic biosynthesis monooxygenase family protein [Acidimicrobiales bacterium]|nr:antibiotic biosynthesis monooxygenase family protein [Acidimicrobiales bacterium]
MPEPPWAMVSELAVEPHGAGALEQAFRDRLGEVDQHPGFVRLEVWRDPRRPGRYLMVSWWTSREAFTAWMHSEAHDRSHARIPDDPAPKPVRFDRYEVIAT